MKKSSVFFVCVILALGLFACAKKEVKVDETQQQSNSLKKRELKDVYTVGITQFDDSEQNVELRKGIVQGFREKGFKEGTNIIYKNQNAKSNNSYITQINNKFIQDNVDMIITIGTDCTLDAVKLCEDKEIPVVYAAVSNPRSQNLCDRNNIPMVNATGVVDKSDIDLNLKLIKTMYPEIKTTGIIFTKSLVGSKDLVDECKYYGSKNDIDIVSIAINKASDIQLAYDTLEKKVDTILLINDMVIEKNLDYIIQKSHELKKPIFATTKNQIKKGAIAGFCVDLLEVGKETGRLASNVLNGDEANSVNVVEYKDNVLYVNDEALKIYNIEKENGILDEAESIS